MAASAQTGSLSQVAVALVLAMILAPAVRGTTAELNHTLGHVWPFSLGHCDTKATPGCKTEVLDQVVAHPPPVLRQAAR